MSTKSEYSRALHNELVLDVVPREHWCCGHPSRRGTLRAFAFQMLMDLGKDVYAEDFETPFLARSAEYYRQVCT